MLFPYSCSYTNYGGSPVKAEYTHEGVGQSAIASCRVPDLCYAGSSIALTYPSKLGGPLWSIHPAIAVFVYRLLHPSVRASASRACGSEKAAKVGTDVDFLVFRDKRQHVRIMILQ